MFFAVEAITVLQWSRLSDHIGRKPVLMIVSPQLILIGLMTHAEYDHCFVGSLWTDDIDDLLWPLSHVLDTRYQVSMYPFLDIQPDVSHITSTVVDVWQEPSTETLVRIFPTFVALVILNSIKVS